MLNSARRLVAALAVAFVLVGALLPLGASTARADDGCYVNGQGETVCSGSTGTPGNPGSGGAPGQPAAFTPGPTSCRASDGTEVPCSTADGWWSDACQGWYALSTPQLAPTTGQDAQRGAYYTCTKYCPAANADGGVGRDCYGYTVWLNAPPAGIDRYTPAQAAGLAKALLVLTPPSVGMAPSEKVHADDPAGTAPYRRTWVGIPVWAWTPNTGPTTTGPQTVTATYGGATVTLTATAGKVIWNTGEKQDGPFNKDRTIACGAGTPFDINVWKNRAAEDSPSCGWRFQHRGDYQVTASVAWGVTWTGEGQNGRFAMPTVTSAPATVHVGELQSVNTKRTPFGSDG